MATEDFDRIPVPGFDTGKVYTDPELLYSTNGFTQKGVTLKGGQGILRLGTILAQHSTTKKYEKYNSAGSNGLDTAVGILRRTVDTDANDAEDQLANIVVMGMVKLNFVSYANTSANVTAAVTSLNARKVTQLGEQGILHF
jgi:hypothetical protein